MPVTTFLSHFTHDDATVTVLLNPRAINVPWRKLEQQLPDLANEVAAHSGKRGVVSHHQPEHGAYLISQCVVNSRECKGFAEDI